MAVKVEQISLGQLESQLHAFETRFDMPSAEFLTAFTNGHLDESRDFRDWSILYSTWRIATRHREQ